MNSIQTNLLREQIHKIIAKLSEEDVTGAWMLVSEFYYDACMLKAIQVAKRSLTPGNSLTREEALEFLSQP